MDEKTRRDEFIERYENDAVPWDEVLPPPELIDFVQAATPGTAVDLGCGYGRSSIYLAQHGWQVDGIDFVPKAIEKARKRAKAMSLAGDVTFHVGSVANLDFLRGPYQFALDIGCMHSLNESQLVQYRDGLCRLLAVKGTYLLFAHLRDELNEAEDERRWLDIDMLFDLFNKGFQLVDSELGITQVEDKPPWKSGWFQFQRIEDDEA